MKMSNISFIVLTIVFSPILLNMTNSIGEGKRESPKIIKFTINGKTNKDNIFKLSPLEMKYTIIVASDSNGVGGYTEFDSLSDGRTWHSEQKMNKPEKVATLKGKDSFVKDYAPKNGEIMKVTLGVYDSVGDTTKIYYTVIYTDKTE